MAAPIAIPMAMPAPMLPIATPIAAPIAVPIAIPAPTVFNVTVSFGSLADILPHCCRAAASGRKADIQMPDFEGRNSNSWIAIANDCFHR